jgi:hypothetical protein
VCGKQAALHTIMDGFDFDKLLEEEGEVDHCRRGAEALDGRKSGRPLCEECQGPRWWRYCREEVQRLSLREVLQESAGALTEILHGRGAGTR